MLTITACRNNNKTVDLSRTVRFANLSSGAKLELVLLSRSPSVVSVALQLPESIAQGTPSSRLVDKFPSTTTFWLLLRKFESGAAGGGKSTLNLTARGCPQVGDGNSGAGRLYHEMPIIQVMGRELSSFVDLQKTLGQLGFNNGNTLLRLSFRTTDTPLEEAMQQIDQYFKSMESGDKAGAHASSLANSESVPDPSQPAIPQEAQDQKTPPKPELDPDTTAVTQEPLSSTTRENQADQQPTTLPSESSTITGPDQRPISVFAPPSSTTPQAVRQKYNEADYEPTVDHARMYQSRLKQSGQNKRLLTDAEIKAQQSNQAQKIADIKEVEIRIRFPDQSSIVTKFSNVDTSESLYELVKGMIVNSADPFSLKYSAPSGLKIIPKDDSNNKTKLIGGLGMLGRVLVTFVWDEGSSLKARSEPTLIQKYREEAKEIKVAEVQGVAVQDDGSVPQDEKGKGKDEQGERRRGGMPKWLKLGGKK